jgi:hypothetical protein
MVLLLHTSDFCADDTGQPSNVFRDGTPDSKSVDIQSRLKSRGMREFKPMTLFADQFR